LPGLANLDHYIAIVAEKSLLRRMITCAARIVDHSFDRQENVKEWVDEVEKEMFDLTAEKSQRTAVPVSDVIKDAIAAIERLYDQHGMTGLPTGFRDLDRLTGGLHPGNLIIIAGRPSMGKTALAMNIAEHVAVDQQKPVGVFSLEMSTQELVIRLLCSRAKVNLRSVHDGFLKSESFHPLTATASELMKAPLYVDDSAALEINQVRSRARRMKLQHGIQLVVVDYLQLMRSPTPRSGTSRQVEIAEISGGLKALAKELQVPVIALSQLNRQPEQREGGTPRLSDLRESGAIEQDADMVGLLVRPEVYEDDADEKRAKEGEATLVIGKQRNGPTGEVQLTFLKEFTRFVDRARVEAEDIPDTGGQRE
jgi:replicative DNA helicase